MNAPGAERRGAGDTPRHDEEPDLVSVVVPCHNAGTFLDRTLESVLGQTHRRLELIVVDDKSGDDSVAIVRRWQERDGRVELIELARNHGAPAHPRNVGVARARGRWVAFLDADDVWHPRKLECQLAALRDHGALMCSTRMRDFRAEREIIFAEPVAVPVERVTLLRQLVKYRTPTSSIVIDRDLAGRLPFNEDLAFKAREDTDCFIRVHEYIDFSIKLRHPFLFYRQQVGQISGNKWRMVPRHLAMLKAYRFRSGRRLGPLAHGFTLTHFAASLWLRLVRRTL